MPRPEELNISAPPAGRFIQPSIHHTVQPDFKLRLYDILVEPVLSYGALWHRTRADGFANVRFTHTLYPDPIPIKFHSLYSQACQELAQW